MTELWAVVALLGLIGAAFVAGFVIGGMWRQSGLVTISNVRINQEDAETIAGAFERRWGRMQRLLAAAFEWAVANSEETGDDWVCSVCEGENAHADWCWVPKAEQLLYPGEEKE